MATAAAGTMETNPLTNGDNEGSYEAVALNKNPSPLCEGDRDTSLHALLRNAWTHQPGPSLSHLRTTSVVSRLQTGRGPADPAVPRPAWPAALINAAHVAWGAQPCRTAVRGVAIEAPRPAEATKESWSRA
ncbi:hypothetical protein COCON_G00051340 [Conger conger]|uniref:Uncharacterized protein n=1 Tax=Conger conger TaxID=82655 RepID=A0A9Q1I5L2_CONCO|nr:hypothetical protein COCON_G00051340 [Conger conger]